MHLLAVDHPRTGLSPRAERALDTYLEASVDIPKPQIAIVPNSKAAYHETDLRTTVMRKEILKEQKKLQIRIYPFLLEEFERKSWGTPTIDPHWLTVAPKINELAQKLNVFIEAAYPENRESADE